MSILPRESIVNVVDRTVSKVGAEVAIRDLAKRFRTGAGEITAMDGVSLTVEGGSVVAVTGPSGSGKSTLLHLVGAIERADAGTIEVDGVDLTGLSGGKLVAYRRTIGLVFQRFHLLPALTVLDNVIAPVLPVRVDFDRKARAQELLAAVGLADRLDAQPAHLSGGQQQRVAIARALISRPKLILADEPTGSLDSTTGAEIMDLLLSLRMEFGVTLMIATHERHVADRCDRIISIRDGRLVGDASGSGE